MSLGESGYGRSLTRPGQYFSACGSEYLPLSTHFHAEFSRAFSASLEGHDPLRGLYK